MYQLSSLVLEDSVTETHTHTHKMRKDATFSNTRILYNVEFYIVHH